MHRHALTFVTWTGGGRQICAIFFDIDFTFSEQAQATQLLMQLHPESSH